jgi:hypothetical protein
MLVSKCRLHYWQNFDGHNQSHEQNTSTQSKYCFHSLCGDLEHHKIS